MRPETLSISSRYLIVLHLQVHTLQIKLLHAISLSLSPCLSPYLPLPPSLSLWLKTESFSNSSGISLPQCQASQSQSFVFPVILYQPWDMWYKPKLQATQLRPLFGGLTWQEGLIVARWSGKNTRIKSQKTWVFLPILSISQHSSQLTSLLLFLNPKLRLFSKTFKTFWIRYII